MPSLIHRVVCATKVSFVILTRVCEGTLTNEDERKQSDVSSHRCCRCALRSTRRPASPVRCDELRGMPLWVVGLGRKSGCQYFFVNQALIRLSISYSRALVPRSRDPVDTESSNKSNSIAITSPTTNENAIATRSENSLEFDILLRSYPRWESVPRIS